MKNIALILSLFIGNLYVQAAGCRNLGPVAEIFEFYVGSETQKETARGQAEAYVKRHGGLIRERMAAFVVYHCLDRSSSRIFNF